MVVELVPIRCGRQGIRCSVGVDGLCLDKGQSPHALDGMQRLSFQHHVGTAVLAVNLKAAEVETLAFQCSGLPLRHFARALSVAVVNVVGPLPPTQRALRIVGIHSLALGHTKSVSKVPLHQV